MRPPLLVLAAFCWIPGAAVAQSLDAGGGAEPPVLETDGVSQSGAARLGDLEDQVDTKSLALEPTLDLTAEQPESLSGTSSLQEDPQPAPGLRLKIPTN